jgi:hypothetical protein
VPHSLHVVTIFPEVSLTVLLIPGTRGIMHFLQYLNSAGIFAFVFLPIFTANDTYLLARSLLPSLKASFDSSVSIEMRPSPMLMTAFLEIRFLDMFPDVSKDTDIKIIYSCFLSAACHAGVRGERKNISLL